MDSKSRKPSSGRAGSLRCSPGRPRTCVGCDWTRPAGFRLRFISYMLGQTGSWESAMSLGIAGCHSSEGLVASTVCACEAYVVMAL